MVACIADIPPVMLFFRPLATKAYIYKKLVILLADNCGQRPKEKDTGEDARAIFQSVLNPLWPTNLSVLVNPEATSYTSSTNYLSAKRSNGNGEFSVKYTKAGTNPSGGGTTNPGELYATPPDTGTYVKIANLYYPTVTIGNQEWMAVNLAGTGGMKDSAKPYFGTFFKFMDLKDIPVPAGWRVPTKQDYIKLVQLQGLEFTPWGSTDGSDIPSKKMLG